MLRIVKHTLFFSLAFVAIGVYFSSTLYGKESPSQSSLNVICTPDKSLVISGETMVIKAWTTSSNKESIRYAWSATDGTIEGTGPEARWDFAGVWPGTYTATVQVNDPSGEAMECSVQVIVRSPALVRGTRENGKSLKTGRAFLLPKQQEGKNYGLYSYLLLTSMPDETTRERYLKAIIEYLRFTDVALFEEAGVDRKGLNITYLPVDTSPSEDFLKTLSKKDLKEKDLAPIAEWMLQHYDYVRARLLLDNLPGNHWKGPYIVSFLKPFDWKSDVAPPYLYQDQSWVPPDLVSEWMNIFLNQAAKERFWEESTGEQLVLNLRTIIGVAAEGVPDVQSSLAGWIKWIRDSG